MNTALNKISPFTPKENDNQQTISSDNDQRKFADVLKEAVEKVNDSQNDADIASQKLAEGEADDLHNVMISGQKASVALETGVQVQQKVIDAYNEIMRMEV